uniref:U-box domain-containing protein n=1 Tax=Alexandrium monilatum TaxID=311494 RepID=A0A7S4QEB1_9DINO
MDQHPSVAAVQAVARAAASEELSRAVGLEPAAALRQRCEEALAALAGGGAHGGDPRPQLEALYALAKQGVGVAGSPPPAQEENSAESGWNSGALAAEAAANSLAALACGFDDCSSAGATAAALELLEALSLDLDRLAGCLFGGLCRLGARGRKGLDPQEARLLRALQGICVWTLAALGRTVGYARLSPRLLWEWAAGDAAWALVLAKGALATTLEDLADLQVPPGEDDGDFVVPADIRDLQRAVLPAVLGLAAPAVAFGLEEEALAAQDEREASIQQRTARLVRHRAELAVGALSCGMQEVLVPAAAQAGPASGPALASFLECVLQPELAEEPSWASSSAAAAAVAAEARRAGKALAERLRDLNQVIWRLLGEAAASQPLPPGFLQDCASLAEGVAPTFAELRVFLEGCLARGAHEPQQLSLLCILAANAGVEPEDSAARALAVALGELPAEARQAVGQRWGRWRGALHAPQLQPWAAALGQGPPAPAAPKPAPALPASPPELGAAAASPLAPPWLLLPGPAAQPGCVLGPLAREAPPEFCCPLDGQLMMDPVSTPDGHVFDRAALANALDLGSGVCPFTGQALSLEQCARQPELRKRIQVWVRGRRAEGARGKPRLASAVTGPG